MIHSKALYTKGVLHNLKMLTQSQIIGTQFRGRIDHLKKFMDALKAMNFGTDALVLIQGSGFQIIMEDSNCFQAVLYVTAGGFAEYILRDGTEARFKVAMNVLCDCLGIFHNPDSSVRLLYKGDGAPLVLVMEDSANNNCVTECSIKTQTETEPIDLKFDDEASLNRIVLRSGDLLEFLNEVDKSCDVLQITMSASSPYFRLRTVGVIQSATDYEVDKVSNKILTFDCKTRSCFSYKMAHIKLLMRSLPLSSKMALSMDANGLLNCQVILSVSEDDRNDDNKVFIEYFLLPLNRQDTDSEPPHPATLVHVH